MDDKLFWYKATVTKVIDGETLDIEFDLGLHAYRKERVRLHGITTPEIFGINKESEEYAKGVEARNFVEERLLGKTVWIHTYLDKTGKNGRYLADIYFQDNKGVHTSISKLLLEDGLAIEKT